MSTRAVRCLTSLPLVPEAGFSVDTSSGMPATIGKESALVSDLPDCINALIASVQRKKPHCFSDIN